MEKAAVFGAGSDSVREADLPHLRRLDPSRNESSPLLGGYDLTGALELFRPQV
jgi:hypothetical protein